MTDTVAAAVISGISTIGAAFVGKLSFDLFRSSRVTLFRKGDKFRGEWDRQDRGPANIDEITVTSTTGGKIKFLGIMRKDNKINKYILEGRENKYCLTFQYYGLEEEKLNDTFGMVLINKGTPENNRLEGVWSQLRKDGKIVSGDVRWIRLSAE